MGDSFWVTEHFQGRRAQRFNLSVEKKTFGTYQSEFRWKEGKGSHLWVFALSGLSFLG